MRACEKEASERSGDDSVYGDGGVCDVCGGNGILAKDDDDGFRQKLRADDAGSAGNLRPIAIHNPRRFFIWLVSGRRKVRFH